MILDLVFRFLPLLGAAGIVLLAQTQIRERSERAALAMSVGGGLEVAHLLAGYFFHGDALWMIGPLLRVASVGGVVYGLIIFADELNPKRPQPLPASLAQKAGVPSIAQPVILGVVAALGVLGTSRGFGSPLFILTALVAIAGAVAGAVWVDRQGPLAQWILERRPELVAWSYVHQLKVINRQTGSSSVHWSAYLGLSTGAKIVMSAHSEQHAQGLVAGVMERCPGVVLGFTDQNAARFKSSPESMRAGSPTLR